MVDLRCQKWVAGVIVHASVQDPALYAAIFKPSSYVEEQHRSSGFCTYTTSLLSCSRSPYNESETNFRRSDGMSVLALTSASIPGAQHDAIVRLCLLLSLTVHGLFAQSICWTEWGCFVSATMQRFLVRRHLKQSVAIAYRARGIVPSDSQWCSCCRRMNCDDSVVSWSSCWLNVPPPRAREKLKLEAPNEAWFVARCLLVLPLLLTKKIYLSVHSNAAALVIRILHVRAESKHGSKV